MNEDCYLWVDTSKPEDDRNVNVLCMDCHKNNPKLGWFWEGSRLGYGPFDFICSLCEHVVHSKEKSEKN